MEVAERLCVLDERLKAIEEHDAFDMDALNMCLVHSLVIPPKFKTRDFEKYKGERCPK